MNDLRNSSEDRPYQPTVRQSPRLAQEEVAPGYYGNSAFDRLRQNRWFPLASVIAAVLIFSGIVSYAYKQGSQTGVNATTPVVQASNENYKEKPKNPGGMDVPFQDAVVFDNLQNKDQTASGDTIESLLPPPEQPVTTKAPDVKDIPTKQAATTNSTETVTPPPVKNEEAASNTPAATETPVTASETAELTPPAATKPAAVTAKTTTTTTAKKMAAVAPASAPAATKIESGAYRIQLGSFRDETAARTAWHKFQQQFNSQLGSVVPQFPQASVPGKGTFYRVQGTNLSKNSAADLCRSINAAKTGSCIVTH